MLQKAWNYKNENQGTVEEIQLILWDFGISIFTIQENKEISEVQSYLFSSPWNIDEGKKIFEQTGLFSHAKMVKKIWMTSPKHLIIPESLYDEGYANQWIRRFHFLNPDESLFSINLQPELNAYIIFPIPERWQLLLKDSFKNVQFESITKLALKQKSEESEGIIQCHIINLPKMTTISLIENQQFISHHVLAYEDSQELIYKIALLLQEKEIAQDIVRMRLEGIAPFWNDLLQKLEEFFPLNIDTSNSTKLSLDFINNLIQCE